MILQIVFGWPLILGFIILATIAARRPNIKLMIIALVWSLPSSLYLFMGNGWIQLVAIYVPVSLGAAIFFIKKDKPLVSKLLILPIYCFYVFLGFSVATQ